MIYDIARKRWYQQEASGAIPKWRYGGCAIAVSAQDGSSHSVYVTTLFFLAGHSPRLTTELLFLATSMAAGEALPPSRTAVSTCSPSRPFDGFD